MALTPPARRPGLTLQALSEAKLLPQELLSAWGVTDTVTPGGLRAVSIQYRQEDGSPARGRFRLKLRDEDPPQGRSRFEWARGDAPIIPYGLWRLQEAREAGYLLAVEGESDCWACWRHHYPALGIPGVQMVNKLGLHHVAWTRTIYVVRERDRKADGSWPGQDFVRGLRERLEAIGWRGRYAVIEMPEGSKDPSDLHVALEGRHEPFRAALERCMSNPVEVVEIGAAVPTTSTDAPPAVEHGPVERQDVPYPLDRLPGWVQEYVRIVNPVAASPTPFLVTTLLPFLGAAIGTRAWVQHGSRPLYPSLWTAILGPSTIAAKSTALDLAESATVRPIQQKYDREYREADAKYRQARQQARKGEDVELPDRPVERRLLYPSDVTWERLIRLMGLNAEEAPDGTTRTPYAVVSFPEIAAFLNSLKRKYAAGVKENLTAMYDCSKVDYGRVGQGDESPRVVIDIGFLCIAGASTPEWFTDAVEAGDVEGGFLPRFLYAKVERIDGRRAAFPKRLEPDALDGFRKLYRRVFEMPEHLRGEWGIDPEARAVYEDWFNAVEDALHGLHRDGRARLIPFWARAQEAALKLALVFAVFDAAAGNGRARLIGAAAMRAAVAQADYHRQVAERVLQADVAETRQERLEKIIVRTLERHGSLTPRDLHRYAHLHRHVRDVVERDALLWSMFEGGVLNVRTDERGNIVLVGLPVHGGGERGDMATRDRSTAPGAA